MFCFALRGRPGPSTVLGAPAIHPWGGGVRPPPHAPRQPPEISGRSVSRRFAPPPAQWLTPTAKGYKGCLVGTTKGTRSSTQGTRGTAQGTRSTTPWYHQLVTPEAAGSHGAPSTPPYGLSSRMCPSQSNAHQSSGARYFVRRGFVVGCAARQGILHRVLGVLHRVLGVLHSALGVLRRALGVPHRVLGVLHRVLGVLQFRTHLVLA